MSVVSITGAGSVYNCCSYLSTSACGIGISLLRSPVTVQRSVAKVVTNNGYGKFCVDLSDFCAALSFNHMFLNHVFLFLIVYM